MPIGAKRFWLTSGSGKGGWKIMCTAPGNYNCAGEIAEWVRRGRNRDEAHELRAKWAGLSVGETGIRPQSNKRRRVDTEEDDRPGRTRVTFEGGEGDRKWKFRTDAPPTSRAREEMGEWRRTGRLFDRAVAIVRNWGSHMPEVRISTIIKPGRNPKWEVELSYTPTGRNERLIEEFENGRRTEKRARTLQLSLGDGEESDILRDLPGAIYIGKKDTKCEFCGCLRYKDEPSSFCCRDGRGVLEIERTWECAPIELVDILLRPEVRDKCIRYNNLFALFGIGTRAMPEDPIDGAPRTSGFSFPRPGGCIRLCGSVYHIARSSDAPGSFRHVFIHDSSESGLDETIRDQKLTSSSANGILRSLFNANHLFGSVSRMRDLARIHGYEKTEMKVFENSTGGGVRVISPTAGGRYDSEESGVVFCCKSKFGPNSTNGVFIDLKHGAVEPLQYPLLFPMGRSRVEHEPKSGGWLVRRHSVVRKAIHFVGASGRFHLST